LAASPGPQPRGDYDAVSGVAQTHPNQGDVERHVEYKRLPWPLIAQVPLNEARSIEPVIGSFADPASSEALTFAADGFATNRDLGKGLAGRRNERKIVAAILAPRKLPTSVVARVNRQGAVGIDDA
jgi:hypothetical protein